MWGNYADRDEVGPAIASGRQREGRVERRARRREALKVRVRGQGGGRFVPSRHCVYMRPWCMCFWLAAFASSSERCSPPKWRPRAPRLVQVAGPYFACILMQMLPPHYMKPADKRGRDGGWAARLQAKRMDFITERLSRKQLVGGCAPLGGLVCVCVHVGGATFVLRAGTGRAGAPIGFPPAGPRGQLSCLGRVCVPTKRCWRQLVTRTCPRTRPERTTPWVHTWSAPPPPANHTHTRTGNPLRCGLCPAGPRSQMRDAMAKVEALEQQQQQQVQPDHHHQHQQECGVGGQQGQGQERQQQAATAGLQ